METRNTTASTTNFLLHPLLLRPHELATRSRIRPYAPTYGKVLFAQIANISKIVAVSKCKIIKISRTNHPLKGYAGKFGTIYKSPRPNAGYAVRYGYASKFDTT